MREEKKKPTNYILPESNSRILSKSDFQESMLNDYEIVNRDLIVEYEKEKGYR